MTTPPRSRRAVPAGWIYATIGVLVLATAVSGALWWALARTSTISSPPSAISTTLPPPPGAGGRYLNARDLIGGLQKRGIACVGYVPVTAPIGALTRGSCYIGDGEVVISMFDNVDEVRADADRHIRLSEGLLDVNLVLGLNWTINVDDPALARMIADAIGGDVIHDPA